MVAGKHTALCLGLLAVACSRGRSWEPEGVDKKFIVVDVDSIQVMHGPVGPATDSQQATYVLVDVRNTSDQDADVTIRAQLEGQQQQGLGWTVKESIRVPAGGRRTFAPVAEGSRMVADAVSASVEVTGALRSKHSAPVVVTDGRVDVDGGHAFVSGWVVNTRDRPVNVIVFAAFYDQQKKVMLRQFSNFTGSDRIAAKGKRGVQFRGPPGSRAAYIFIGQTHYGVARVWGRRRNKGKSQPATDLN